MKPKRPDHTERIVRYEKLVRFTCDFLEGKYVLPTGKLSKPGSLNKSEVLRAAEYPASYKNAYMIFDKESFKADLVTEQARRRDIDATLPDVRLEDEGDDQLLERLVNRELLYRLRYSPGKIETDTLLRFRSAVQQKKPPGSGGAEGGGGTRNLFSANQLIVMLDGKIPAEALAKLEQRSEDVIDVDDAVEG